MPTLAASGADVSVVVTGAAQGIGRAIALDLHGAGWRVVALDERADGLALLASSLGSHALVTGDVSDGSVLDEATARATEMAPLGGWVNNAAIPALGRLDEISDATIARGLAVDLEAVILGAKRAVKSFLSSRTQGAIVNLSSVHAKAAYPRHAVYDAAKGGVESFTRYVAAEYGHLGIRCNAVAPGAVVTDRILGDRSHTGLRFIEELRRFSPMGALIPEDSVARLVRFLLSPESEWVTGQCVAIDGGLLSRAFAFPADPDIPWGEPLR